MARARACGTLAGMSTCALLALALLAADPVPRDPRGSSAGTVAGLDLMDVDLMFVGAHPDDDTGVMGTFARYLLDEGFRGTVVTLTGGEGGGNATGPEAGMALGLIRREEERRALQSLGVESPRFLGLTDFYFTLSAEETESRWGGQSFVCDVVREVRLRRPEVIVTMWPGPGTHGQHQMAARAATLAWAEAGEPATCPEQVQSEGLKPFAPSKLYYYDRPAADDTIAIRTDDLSPSRRLRYADLKSLAVMHYKSQGYDTGQNVPAREARPESFLLVASRVPVSRPEEHLLEGALLPAGNSPPGIGLSVRPAAYEAPVGAPTPLEIVLRNGTGVALEAVALAVDAPTSWTAEGAAAAERLEPGAELRASFTVTPGPDAALDKNARVLARYTARRGDAVVAGANRAWMRPVAPVAARVKPLHDVAGYRAFAARTGTDWVIETLPARVPAPVGTVTPVAIEVTNRGPQPVRGELAFELPAGVTLESAAPYAVAPGATATVNARLSVTAAARSGQRNTAQLPFSVAVPGGGRDRAEIYAIPAGAAPRLTRRPVVDGQLDDLPAPTVSIGAEDRWWRRAPDSPADLSAETRLGWDAENLYVGVHVRDEAVACNIPPDDVKSQLRSDAVGITVDPTGSSRDTSTTLQFAAFPCTTAGWGARGFRDADARPGPIELTATGAKVAAVKTEDGYTLEVALPWSAMPARPRPGATIGLNVVLYDGDQQDARPGANISETGLAWSAFEWGGKQALPYTWPRVTLAP
jgi:LmbE family N-acetylglucosaminyl deacetylase